MPKRLRTINFLLVIIRHQTAIIAALQATITTQQRRLRQVVGFLPNAKSPAAPVATRSN